MKLKGNLQKKKTRVQIGNRHTIIEIKRQRCNTKMLNKNPLKNAEVKKRK